MLYFHRPLHDPDNCEKFESVNSEKLGLGDDNDDNDDDEVSYPSRATLASTVSRCFLFFECDSKPLAK